MEPLRDSPSPPIRVPKGVWRIWGAIGVVLMLGGVLIAGVSIRGAGSHVRVASRVLLCGLMCGFCGFELWQVSNRRREAIGKDELAE